MKTQPAMTKSFRTVAIIPAAGSGIRMGSHLAKQFLDINGTPLLAATLKPFQACRLVHAIIVVVPEGDVDYCIREIVEPYGFQKVKQVIPGGKRRQDSVRLGIEAAGDVFERILIHDGVRPLVDVTLITRLIEESKKHRAVIPAIRAKDTVKKVDASRWVLETYSRAQIWLVQTPQIFRYRDIQTAHEKAVESNWGEATDDSFLIEKLGIPVKVIEGSESNIKVTTQTDLEWVRRQMI